MENFSFLNVGRENLCFGNVIGKASPVEVLVGNTNLSDNEVSGKTSRLDVFRRKPFI